MENTPYYFYDLNLLTETLTLVQNEIKHDLFKVHYAVKANNNKQILSLIAAKGFGADCVSAWEIEASIAAGFAPKDIVFAGVGKTDAEIQYAIHSGIGMIHCESFEEIVLINTFSAALNKTTKIALRLNPNVNAFTHEKISTGLTENKFGMTNFEFHTLIERQKEFSNVQVVGMHFHIGSQIQQTAPFEALCKKIMEFVPQFEAQIGPLLYLNVGGGLGVDYVNPDLNPIADFGTYFNTFRKGLSRLNNIPIHFELGRSIVAQCGSLISKVLYIKRGENKTFAVLDAGMTELLRPALYGAAHKIEKTNSSEEMATAHYDVVGPICESSDCFGTGIALPLLKRGDLVTIRTCGAYAESMALRYNGRKAIANNLTPRVNTTLRMVKTA
jgi:diaminopimelate decarboxylase